MYEYNDKLKGSTGRLSVLEILQKVGSADYKDSDTKEYKAVDIDKVKIDGNVFTNYGQYQFIWEKSFFKQPDRSASGSIDNIDSYPTFLTPHLIIDFSVMSIDDYRKIMKLHYEKNEHLVECYDPIYNKKISVNMYFATEEMAKLYTISQHRVKSNGGWEDWVDLVGVTEYKVELIGTNTSVYEDEISITYVYNPPNGQNVIYGNQTVDSYLGEEVVIGSEIDFKNTPPRNMTFKHWESEDGTVYTDGRYITVVSDLVLKAVWQSTTTFTLSFNYGLSDIYKKVENNIETEVLSIEVQQGVSIGQLPTLTNPKVKYQGVEYEPYKSGAWYRTPVIQEDMKVANNSTYWTNRSSTIYALYEKKQLSLTYDTKFSDITMPPQNAHYQDNVYLPTLVKYGYSFGGWYTDELYQNKFDGIMPPKDTKIYAKWEAE